MFGNNNTDYTSLSDEDLAQTIIFFGYPDGLLKFAAACCIIFMIIGIPGNLITIFALWRCKKVRNATAIFIINLTLSDLINCCVNLPIAANTFWTERWLHGSLVCTLFVFARFGLFAVAYFSVLCITINRYILVVHPYKYSKLFTNRNITIIICCVWMFSFVPVIPTMFGEFGRFGLNPVSGYCSMLPDHNQVNPMKALFIISFVVPSIAILVCYSRIYHLYKKTNLKVRNPKKRVISDFEDSSQQSPEQSQFQKHKSANLPLTLDSDTVIKHPRVISLRSEDANTVVINPESNSDVIPSSEGTKLTRNKLQLSYFSKLLPTSKDKRLLSMLSALIVAFIVCNLPLTAVQMYNELQPHPVAFIIATLLKYLTICINPLLYVVISHEYRIVYKKVFNFTNYKKALCPFRREEIDVTTK